MNKEENKELENKEETCEEIEKDDTKEDEDIKKEDESDVPEEGENAKEPEETDPVAEINDKYLRLVAEFDNFKKRTQKEKIQIYTNAAADVIDAILPFIDNINRATSVEVESEDAKNLKEGILLVEKQFTEALKNLGVTEIKAVGEKFDPNIHNAVMHVDDESVDGEEIVVEEFIKGYMYKDKVIRHSTVKVAN